MNMPTIEEMWLDACRRVGLTRASPLYESKRTWFYMGAYKIVELLVDHGKVSDLVCLDVFVAGFDDVMGVTDDE